MSSFNFLFLNDLAVKYIYSSVFSLVFSEITIYFISNTLLCSIISFLRFSNSD